MKLHFGEEEMNLRKAYREYRKRSPTLDDVLLYHYFIETILLPEIYEAVEVHQVSRIVVDCPRCDLTIVTTKFRVHGNLGEVAEVVG